MNIKIKVSKGLELAYEAMEKFSQIHNGDNQGASCWNNARYGVIKNDGTSFEKTWACHSYTKHFNNPLIVYSQYVRKSNMPKDVHHRYLKWITGKNSPWRSFRGATHSHIFGKKNYRLDRGFIWSSLSKHPSNLQQSFLIATRMPSEWVDMILIWDELVKGHKINPSLAFYFLPIFFNKSDCVSTCGKYHNLCTLNIYDYPVDTYSYNQTYMNNFLRGKINLSRLLKPFSEDQNYRPVNSIWGGRINKGSYQRFLLVEYGEKFSVGEDESKKIHRKSASKFGLSEFNRLRHTLFTKDQVIEIIKKEQERLGL